MTLKRLTQEVLPLFLFTLLGFLVMGYHPGFEDDGIYLTAVKARLDPTLFPHDADFFRLQMQATVFDGAMAHFVSLTHIPVAWAELLWQFAALFLILWACLRIASQLFAELPAQWAAVAMAAALLTLPVAGTALNIADQHLHPRNLATAFILIAVCRILDNKQGHAILWLFLAFLFHPLMAVFGVSFCVILTRVLHSAATTSLPASSAFAASAAPFSWLFAPDTPAWREALATRTYYSIYRWTWYEWLGALGPLLLFFLLWRFTKRPSCANQNSCDQRIASFSLAVFAYGALQQVLAMALLAPPSPVRLIPLQPMRYLQLVYLFMAIVGGGLLGRHLLKKKIFPWTIFLLVMNGGMFLVQREMIPGTHLELPGFSSQRLSSQNPWLQAFAWIRCNTPKDAYFALNPQYLAAPGEGFRSFRALAERSQLSDGIKDTAVVVQVPSLAPLWHQQQLTQAGWNDFDLVDFEHLKAQWRVDWALVSYPQPDGLDCRWHNQILAVCKIP